MNLSLVKQESFGAVQCDFYRNGKHDVWMTREQIGQALGYAEPKKAIGKVHERNKDRLDKHSTFVKMTNGNGKLSDTYIYNPKGVYEICRWSKQPKANAFMDFVWEIIESLRLEEHRRLGDYDKKLHDAIDPLKLLGLDDSKTRVRLYNHGMNAIVKLAKIAHWSPAEVGVAHERLIEELGMASKTKAQTIQEINASFSK